MMKKPIFFILIFLLLLSSQSWLSAQQVRTNSDQVIEVNAQSISSLRAVDDQLQDQVTDFSLYTIEIADLRKAAKLQGSEVKLNLNFSDQDAWKLNLQVNDLRSPNFRMVASGATGEQELTPLAPHTYRGTNEAGEMVRLNITKNAIWGYIQRKEETLNIFPLREFIKDADPNTFIVCKSQDVIALRGKECGNVTSGEQLFDPGAVYNDAQNLMMVDCAIAELATDADFEYFQAFGNNAIVVNQNIEGDLNLVEGLYQDQIGLTFSIVFQNVWTTSADPYSGNASATTVNQVQSEWEDNRTDIQRDLVHLFTGRGQGNTLGRVIALGTVCSAPSDSYGFSVNSSFSHDIVGHEIGHNFNGDHDESSGCGLFGSPTLMCPTLPANLNFSSSNRNRIINHINANSACVTECCPVFWDAILPSFFETGLGPYWTQDTDDDINWDRQSGGTTSSNTGPSAAYEGSFYMYVEASGGNSPSREANLVSPCIDLTGESGVALTFAYHMQGSSMGTLRVQISEDFGETWTTLWTRAGSQGSNWLTGYVPLPTDNLEVVQMRFNAVTGSGWSSDIAIDEVRIGRACEISATQDFFEFDASGGTMTSMILPSGEAWEIRSPEIYPWLTVTPSSGNGGLNQTVTITVDPNGNVGGRAALMSVHCGISRSISFSVVQAGQPINAGPCDPPYASIPADQSFETTSPFPFIQDTNDDINWSRTSGGTPSTNTGPTAAFDGNFYYFTEASFGNSNMEANLISPCLDLTSIPNPEISFAYHMLGTSMGTLRLESSINGGFVWTELWSRSGNQGSNWLTETIDLSALANIPGVLIRFNATTGPSWSSDIAIDAISITAGAGSCYDQYEPNDTYQNAHGNTGSSLNFPNACLAAGESDYFLFIGSGFTPYYVSVRGANSSVTGDYRISINQSGSTVTIETHPEGGSTTDTYLRLYDTNGTTLLASDNNSGVGLFSRIVRTFPGLIDRDQPSARARSISDLDNIPNPFANTTTFVFSLEQEQQVDLNIFDVNGKVVAQPLRGATMAEGLHQIEFDAKDLPPGVYFYSLRSAENVQTKQMLIVR